MDFVQQRHQLQIKQEVEQEQKVCLESVKNQHKGQQEMNKNSTSVFGLLCEQEKNKKLSIEQLDQQILIKTKKIAELGRQEMLKKQQLGEVMQKIKSQKRMLEVLESQAQNATETWKCNFENLEQSWNCRVAEINEEEGRRLKKVEDKERTLRIEIAQKETVERETTRKEFELELEKVKKSIAEGHAKLKKIYRQAKPIQNYLQQNVPMPANQQSPIHLNQPNLPASPVDIVQCVPLQPPPIRPNQSIQSGLFPQLPLSALPAQPSVICYAPSTSKLAPTVTPVTSTLIIPKSFTFTKSFTTTSNLISSSTSTFLFANSFTSPSPSISLDNSSTYSKFIPSTTTSTWSKSSPPLSSITSNSSTSTSFSANLDKSFDFDNGIEIITIDDLDDNVEEELTGLDDCGTIEDNDTLKSINPIPKNFSTIDELIDVNPIGGNDIAPVGTTVVAVKPMDNFENEPTESTDKIIVPLVPETSIQNFYFGNDSDSVDDQFELVGGQNDNQQLKFTSKTSSDDRQQKIKTKRLSKLRNNEKRNEERQPSLEQCRGHYCLRKRQPTLQQNEEEPEQQQNSQTSSELNEMGQNGKLRYDTDIDNRATLKSKENGRGRKRNCGGGVETSKQSKQSKRERRRAQRREWMKRKRANETPEERELRLAQMKEYDKQRRANETPEQRENRLLNMRECNKQRLANETPEQRELRLAQQRECEKQRRANETPEQRESHLANMRECNKQKIANETPEQRERRLKYQCDYYKEIIANKTPKQRKCRNRKQQQS